VQECGKRPSGRLPYTEKLELGRKSYFALQKWQNVNSVGLRVDKI